MARQPELSIIPQREKTFAAHPALLACFNLFLLLQFGLTER